MKIVDYNKIKDNIKNLKEHKQLMLVLKDDAYNFDLEKVCVISLSLGIKDFAVKNIYEAVKIRKLSSEANILIFGKIMANINLIKKYNIIVTVINLEDLKLCLKHNIRYHVEIKTSMNRFGINYHEITKYISPNLEGIYIHTPVTCVDENSLLLDEFTRNIKKYNLSYLKIHVGGSGFLEIHHGYINRIGCALYKDSVKYFAKVIQVKKVTKGKFIGYNHFHGLTSDSLIAICDVGYVNGLSRENKHSYCYINNKKYFFEGYKCMDYSFILVDEDVRVGDIVEILGVNITEEQFCNMNNLIVHQVYLYLN